MDNEARPCASATCPFDAHSNMALRSFFHGHCCGHCRDGKATHGNRCENIPRKDGSNGGNTGEARPEPNSQEALTDRLTEMREWKRSETGEIAWWPYCTACDCWMDSAHMAGKRHQNKLHPWEPSLLDDTMPAEDAQDKFRSETRRWLAPLPGWGIWGRPNQPCEPTEDTVAMEVDADVLDQPAEPASPNEAASVTWSDLVSSDDECWRRSNRSTSPFPTPSSVSSAGWFVAVQGSTRSGTLRRTGELDAGDAKPDQCAEARDGGQASAAA